MKAQQNLQIITPNLPNEEIWFRNQYHKNWGNLHPILFKKGIPTFVLPSYHRFAFLIFSIVLLSVGCGKENTNIILRAGLGLASLFVFGLACRSGHGIVSSSLPFLNQMHLRLYKGYCEPCRTFSNTLSRKNNFHCSKCNVCYEGVLYHSAVLGVCVTDSNFCYFLSANLLVFGLIATIIYELFDIQLFL